MDVIRPGDANETAQAWKAALEATSHPTCLIFSRQALPTLDRSKYAAADGVLKGGYVLADSDGTPDVILIATGSELSLAVQAHERLASDGVKSRVVSLPSWFRFEREEEAYRDSVLPPATRARLAIEMGGEMGWAKYVGSHGDTVTMSTFGASAPIAKLADKFGFTVDNVVAKAKALIAEAASTHKE